MDLQQRAINRTLTKTDLYVMGLAVIGLLIIMALLLDDRLFFKIGFQTLGQHPKIASTTHSVKDVRRRVDTDIIWLPLFNSDDVYESDAIYTGVNSETEITMDNGVKFELEPESLVVIHRDQIELQQGTLWSSGDQPQKIKITTPYGDAEFPTKKGQFKIVANPGAPPVVVENKEPPKFSFNELAPPSILFPKDGSSIELKTEDMKAVLFQWSSPEKIPKYKIQISSDSTFKDIVWESEAKGENLASNPLKAGNYFWRVESINEGAASNWSTASFRLAKFQPPPPVPEPAAQPTPKPLLRAPKLKSKHQTYKIESNYKVRPKSFFEKLFSLILPMAQADTEQIDSPKLDWEKLPGATAYEIEVAKDSEFKNIFVKKKVTQNQVRWNSKRPGTFYWHVRGIDQDGRPGEFSEVSSIDLILIPPRVLPPLLIQGSTDKMTFSWNRVPFARGYEIQLSDNPDFNDPTILTTKGTSLEVTLPPNSKFWRVRATTVPPKFDGKFSKTQAITREQTKISTVGQIKPLILKPLGPRPGYPILFDPTDLGVEISEPQLDYEVTEKNEVRIGEIYIDGEGIDLSLTKKTTQAFVFTWPKALLDSGKISLVSADGKTTILTDNFTLKTLLLSGENVTFTKVIPQEALKKLGDHAELKFCAESDSKTFKNSFCSKTYNCTFGDLSCKAIQLDATPEATVKINNTQALSKGVNPVKFGEKITFDSEGHGSSLHLETQISPFQVRDIVMQDKDTVVLSGNGATPFNAKVLEKDDFNWRTAMLLDRPTVYFVGENNLVFKTDIKIHGPLPLEKQRGFINFKSPRSTYVKETKLLGLFENPKHKVSSSQREANSTSDKEFEWYFATPEKGNANTDKISLTENSDNPYVGRYSVYRGYNYEATGRFTAAFTNANNPLILGELSGSYWFERIFKCENRTFCFQRWGVTAKYFNTIVSASNATGNTTTLSGFNADLRYRLTPGVSNQDETFGLLLGYQNVTYTSAQGSMLGVGGFWIKPMPSFIDRFFNYVKWFRYPKILDAEITYYPISATSGTTTGTNLDLLLRGKMFIKPNLFLEASLGYRQFIYSQPNIFQVQCALFLWTGGIGLDF